MRRIILAIFCFLSISSFAQESDSTTFVQESDSTRGKQKLQFKSPFSQEGDRMKFSLDLPGRRPMELYIPKIFYAPSPPPFDPEVAWRRSILIPGWGQYYNRQAWKIPFVYAGYGTFGYLIYSSHSNYKDFQRAYRIRIQRDEQGLTVTEADSLFMLTSTAYEAFAPDNLKGQRNTYRKSRDRYILYSLGFHLLQTLESYITAHLRDLDFSDDLSLRIEPGIIRGAHAAPGAGLGLTLKF